MFAIYIWLPSLGWQDWQLAKDQLDQAIRLVRAMRNGRVVNTLTGKVEFEQHPELCRPASPRIHVS